MKNLIIERLIKSVLLIVTSLVLGIISIVFFIMFFSEKEAVILCIIGFFTSIVFFIIGVYSFKSVKKIKKNEYQI